MLGKLTGRTVKASWACLLVDVSSYEVLQAQWFEESVTKSPKQVRRVCDEKHPCGRIRKWRLLQTLHVTKLGPCTCGSGAASSGISGAGAPGAG